MTGLLRSELLKIRTTAVPWVLAGIAVLLEGLVILTLFLQNRNFQGGYVVPATTQQLRNLLGAGFRSGYLMALLLGVLVITTEFRHKTVTTSFLVTPRRPVFVAGKLVATAILGVLLGVLLLVTALIGGGLTLVARGGSFGALVRQLPAVAPGFLLVFALFAILGAGVGSILTNQVAAIIASLGWFIVGELILVGLVHSAYRWTPTGAGTAASNLTRDQGTNTFALFSWWQGSLLMLGYGLGFALLGSYLLTRRDIT
jgi:ABC-type transport system involved in multi-copper enzyme maturation permease subunit